MKLSKARRANVGGTLDLAGGLNTYADVNANARRAASSSVEIDI